MRRILLFAVGLVFVLALGCSADEVPSNVCSPSCDSGYACINRTCQEVDVAVSTEYKLFPEDQFPTSLSHLFGSEVLPWFARLTLRNLTGSERQLRLELDLVGFSEPAAQTITLAGNEERVVEMRPTFDFDALAELATGQPSALRVRATVSGTSVFEENREITVLSKNTMFWNFPGTEPDPSAPSIFQIAPLAPFICAWVTPHDRELRVQSVLSAAAGFMPGNAMVGYQDLSIPERQFDLGPGQFISENVYLTTGNEIAVRITDVSGGDESGVGIRIIKDEDLDAWINGSSPESYASLEDVSDVSSLKFTADHDGSYRIIYFTAFEIAEGRSVDARVVPPPYSRS